MDWLTNDKLLALTPKERVRYVIQLHSHWEPNIEIPVIEWDLLEIPPSQCPDIKQPWKGQPTTGKCQSCHFFLGSKDLRDRPYKYGETIHACCALRLNAKLNSTPLTELQLPDYFTGNLQDSKQ